MSSIPPPVQPHSVRLLKNPYIAPLGIFLGMLLLYLTTLTRTHTFDALSYVTSVELKPWRELFHPHHLAYGPLGMVALAAGKALGYGGGAALPMQIVNATAGALGVALFFAIVRRVTRQTVLALAAAMLLGGAYAYWYYAVEIEVYTVATLFLLICLDLLIRQIEEPSRHRMFMIGLAQGGAILFHQTNVLFSTPLAVALLALPERTGGWRQGLRGWWLYLLALALAVSLPYLFVGVIVSGFRTWHDFVAWSTSYASVGLWGGSITARKWADLGAGLADTLAQPGGAVLWLLLAGLVLARFRDLLQASRALVGALVTWLLAYGAFFLWWEPHNIEFWIASLPAALLLVALALRSEQRPKPGILIVLAVAICVLGLNRVAIIRRGDPNTDHVRVLARALGEQSGEADLLLVPDGPLELYLPYYEHRYNHLSIRRAFLESGEVWENTCGAVRARIEAAREAGAAVLVADEVLHPALPWLERHHLEQAQIDACFAPYREALRPLSMPASAPPYWRLAGKEEGDG